MVNQWLSIQTNVCVVSCVTLDMWTLSVIPLVLSRMSKNWQIHAYKNTIINLYCQNSIRFNNALSISAFPSAARGDLVVPTTRLQPGKRAFCGAGPVAWNSLPLDILSAPTLSTFKNMLKTSFLTFLLYEQRTLYDALVVTLKARMCRIN